MLICAALLMFRCLPDRRHHLGRLRVLWLLLHAQPCDQPGHPNRQVDTKVDLPHVGYDFLGPPLDRVALICGETERISKKYPRPNLQWGVVEVTQRGRSRFFELYVRWMY